MRRAVIAVGREDRALRHVHGRTLLEHAFDHLQSAGADRVRVLARSAGAGLLGVCRELGVEAEPLLDTSFSGDAPTSAVVVLPVEAALTRSASLSRLFGHERAGQTPLRLEMAERAGLAMSLPASRLEEWARAFAASRDAAPDPDCEPVPVPDAFCLGMEDFNHDSLECALDHLHLPTVEECHVLLSMYRPKPERLAHCLAVSKAALRMALALNRACIPVDVCRTHAAALVHDMCKGRPDHAETGARELRSWGFYGVADEVARHIDLGGEEITEEQVLSEAGIVYLADKLFDMDRFVGLDEKTRHRLTRVPDNPQRQRWMQESNDRLCASARIFESALGDVDLGFSLWGPQSAP